MKKQNPKNQLSQKSQLKKRGKHLLLDMRFKQKIYSGQVFMFLNRLPDRIAMRKLSKAIVCNNSNGTVSGYVILYTSHISFHESLNEDNTSNVAIDVYSCKNFSVIKCLKSIKELLGNYKIIKKQVVRRCS